ETCVFACRAIAAAQGIFSIGTTAASKRANTAIACALVPMTALARGVTRQARDSDSALRSRSCWPDYIVLSTTPANYLLDPATAQQVSICFIVDTEHL